MPFARRLARGALPSGARTWLRSRGLTTWPPVGWARVGMGRRTQPVSRWFGFDRGTPIDRWYIERFLATHRNDIRGRVLEIGDDTYTRRFGVAVDDVDILHVDDSNPRATIIADLGTAGGLETGRFDCVICTQTLLLIYDVRVAIANLESLLKPGGVVLATVPGISQICRLEADAWGDYWRFTGQSVRRLFEEAFPSDAVSVETFGNVQTATAFLHGIAAEELRRRTLDRQDPDYQVTIAVRAVKTP